MSIFSDYRVGALTDDEFRAECLRLDAEESDYREEEASEEDDD